METEKNQITIEENALVNGNEYRVLRLLGHGKDGYSYLAERGGRKEKWFFAVGCRQKLRWAMDRRAQ